jgi:capsular polysaccharide biosynthesis protein
MELTQILNTLRRVKILVAAVAVVAVLAAISTSYSITTSGLVSKSHAYGAAQTQILIDSPRSSLIDLSQETAALASRAAVYAQFMRSNAVKAYIGRAVGISGDGIATSGPFTTAGGTQNIPRPSEARSNEVAAEQQQYRLVFDYQQDLPIVSVYAQAPTADMAIKLASGTVTGVQAYIAKLESQTHVPANAKTVVRELGSPDGGWVSAGVNPIMMVLAFIAVMILGCFAIVLFMGFRQRRVERVVLEDYEDDEPVASELDLEDELEFGNPAPLKPLRVGSSRR